MSNSSQAQREKEFTAVTLGVDFVPRIWLSFLSLAYMEIVSGNAGSASDGSDSVTLLERFQMGDEDALNRLLVIYRPRILRIVHARLGPKLRARVEAEDLCQDALLSATKALRAYKPQEGSELIHFLAQLVEHQILHQVEYLSAQCRDMDLEEQLSQSEPRSGSRPPQQVLMSDSSGPITRAQRREMSRLVDDCLSELREDYREVILLRDFAGARWGFVAKEMQSPSVNAALKLHQRAIVELAAALHRRM
jgi:RNA polymerase sigma-70 factor (subfamily 1)